MESTDLLCDSDAGLFVIFSAQKQSVEHLIWSGRTGEDELGAHFVSDGCLGSGLLLRLEGSQIHREGKTLFFKWSPNLCLALCHLPCYITY